MDNNFNMQPNNMQQPMGQPMQQPMGQPMQQPMQQPMYQQPMGQPMQQPMYQQPMGQPMYQQPKKSNKGLMIGIIAAVSVLLIAIVTIVLVLVLGGGDDLVGTWKSEDGIELTLKKDNTGTMGMSGINMPIKWERDGDKLEMTISFMGESETEEMTIVKLSKKTLILSDESGEEQTFTKE